MVDKEKLQLKEHNTSLLDKSKKACGSVQLAVVATDHCGEVLHHFPNRMVAAKYIVKEIKHIDTPERKKIMQVYGNLYSGIKNAWKVYGFYWKLIEV